jgi:short-subunit dehydrogenase
MPISQARRAARVTGASYGIGAAIAIALADRSEFLLQVAHPR